jgi:hypothetical protein
MKKPMLETTGSPATLKYLDGRYDVIVPGSYVVCAVSGRKIPLDALRYWNVERQEAYATPQIALQQYQKYRKAR